MGGGSIWGPDFINDDKEFPPTPIISSLKDLLNEFCYSWDFPQYDLVKTKSGNFVLNKLCITPERVTYKTEEWILTPGVFAQVEALYFLLNNQSEKEF